MNKSSTLQNSLMLAPLIGATDSWMTALGVWLMFIVVISAFGVSMGALRSRLDPGDTFAGRRAAGGHADQLRGTRRAGLVTAMAPASGDLCRIDALQCVVLDHTGFFQSAWRDRLRLCGLFGALMVGLGLLRELLGNGRLAPGHPGPWRIYSAGTADRRLAGLDPPDPSH